MWNAKKIAKYIDDNCSYGYYYDDYCSLDKTLKQARMQGVNCSDEPLHKKEIDELKSYGVSDSTITMLLALSYMSENHLLMRKDSNDD